MKAPSAEKLAASIAQDHPNLAVDLLVAGGYTRRAARKAIAEGAAPFARESGFSVATQKDTNT